MREKETILRQEEKYINARINKASKLNGTWECIRVCKTFLEEWEGDWVEWSEKARERQEFGRQEIEKNERFRIIDIKLNLSFKSQSSGKEGGKSGRKNAYKKAAEKE